MDADIQASLEAVIDANPVLASASLSPAPSLTNTPQPHVENDANIRSPSLKKNDSKSRPIIVPNSAADFRRREANRLAAERSRSRTSEKYTGLELASKELREENERLRNQIAELEGLGGDSSQQQSILEDVHQSFKNSDGHAGAGPSNHRVASGEDQTAREEEQEAHSNTILAALTGITGVDFSQEENDQHWMQDMDALLKESEASGRLAELAVVATEQNEPSSETTRPPPNQPSQIDQEIDPDLQDKAEENGNVEGFKQRLIPSPANNPIIALAAAINTEVERIIMEDLAITKAAIATLEKQIEAQKNGQPLSEEGQEDIELSLPGYALLEDVEKLSICSKDLINETTNIQDGLSELHTELIKLRDERTGEEKKVIDLIEEVKGLEITDEADKSAFMSGLRALGGFVESLLSDPRGGDLSYATGSYSTPAIARRRRGRPPKGDISRTFYQSFLLKHSPHSKSDHLSATGKNESENPPKLKNKIIRKPKKSKLQREIESNDEENVNVENDLRQIQASAEDHSQTPTPRDDENENENGENVDNVVQPEQGEIEPTEQITEEAVNRAEQFILSQLAQTQDHEEQNVTTSFVDFLPAQEELERQASAMNNSNSDDIMGTSVTVNTDGQQQDVSANGGNTGQGVVRQISESALARLKKGPPGSCDICTRTSTTVWRKLVLGDQILKVCNACGLYHKKFGVIRPPELWDDGNSIRRRRTGARASTKGDGEEEGTDSERPTKKARKGINHIKQIDHETSITNGQDDTVNINLVEQHVIDLDVPIQDEDGRREFNATLMEGISAISATHSASGQQEESIQFDITTNQVIEQEQENQSHQIDLNLQIDNSADNHLISETQARHDDGTNDHPVQRNDLESVFGM